MRNVYAVIASKVLSKHDYVVGVYNKKHAAQVAANYEEQYRGGKYVCVIDEWIVNKGISGKHVPDYPKRIPRK